VNLKIKDRESFRPFAPSVLEDKVGEYFAIDVPSPYMLLTAQVHDRIQQDPVKAIPAVTHVDGSARLQTVSRAQNALYYDLIKKFEEKTGCAVIINTSFNVRGEPIVCTPHDAYLCFMRTEMDYLVVGSFILDKKQMQPLREDINWRDVYQLD
jgi:carbamoyltransferase